MTLPDGRVGEVWIASPSVARGYWNETNEIGPRDDDSPTGPPRDDSSPFGATLAPRSTTFPRGFAAAEIEKERYLRTGDLAYMRRGELYVVGRVKDLIVIGGRNIAPEDVERTVRETRWSHRGRGVLGARILRPGSIAAFAVDDGGGVVRESLAVVAEVRDGVELAPADLGVVVDGIVRAVSKAHGVTIPRCHVALLRKGAAPKTTSGKIRRGECARRFVARELEMFPGMGASGFGSSAPPPFPEGSAGLAHTLATRGSAALAESMDSALLAHCREALACPNLSERCGLVARGGMDSFAALRLLRRIEHDIGAALPADAVLREGATVRSIVRAVLPHVRAPPPPRPRRRRRRRRAPRVHATGRDLRRRARSGGDHDGGGAPGAVDDAGGSERSPRFPAHRLALERRRRGRSARAADRVAAIGAPRAALVRGGVLDGEERLCG